MGWGFESLQGHAKRRGKLPRFKYNIGQKVLYRGKEYEVQFQDRKGVRDPNEAVYYLKDGPMVKESDLKKA